MTRLGLRQWAESRELTLRLADSIVVASLWLAVVLLCTKSPILSQDSDTGFPEPQEMFFILGAGVTALPVLAFRWGLITRLLLGNAHSFRGFPCPSKRSVVPTRLDGQRRKCKKKQAGVGTRELAAPRELSLRLLDAILAGVAWTGIVCGPAGMQLSPFDDLPSLQRYLLVIAVGSLLQIIAFRAGLTTRLLLGKGRLFQVPPEAGGRRVLVGKLEPEDPLEQRALFGAIKSSHIILATLAMGIVGPFALYLIMCAATLALFFLAMVFAASFSLLPVWLTVQALVLTAAWHARNVERFYEFDEASGRLRALTRIQGLETEELVIESTRFLTVLNHSRREHCTVVVVADSHPT